MVIFLLFSAASPAIALDLSEVYKSSGQGPIESNDMSMGLTIGENSNTKEFNNVPILSEQIAQQAQETAEEEVLQLNLSAEPAIYIPNKPIRIKWELEGKDIATLKKEGIEILARPPDGVIPVNKKDAPETDGSLKIPAVATQGTVIWEALDYAEFPLVFTFEARKNDEIIATNTIVIDQPLATTNRGQASKITSDDSKVKVNLPSNAVKNPLLMDIRYPSPNALPVAPLSWNPVEIIAVDSVTEKNVTKFDSAITIQIAYTEEDLRGWAESDLSIFYYDPEINDWFPIETVVDTKNNILRLKATT